MEPTRSPQATLVDLLDRILDKGILLNTDLIICVSGIPLLGINLKLALAGMETMLQYGIMVDWDEAQRSVAAKEAKDEEPPLEDDEYVIYSVFGTHWYSKGIYESWRAGTIYITNKRILMFRKMPAEVLMETSYEQIRALTIKEKPHYTGITRQEIHLLLKEDAVIKLHTNDIDTLKEAIENTPKFKNLSLEDASIFPKDEEEAVNFLLSGEEITFNVKIWCQIPFIVEGTTKYEWKPGHLYLTDRRLCFWYDFGKRLVLEIPCNNIMHSTIESSIGGNTLVGENSLLVLYKAENENKVACFSSNDTSLMECKKILDNQILEQNTERDMESCPKCGKKSNRAILLDKGCPYCGWVSHREKHGKTNK